MIDFIFDFFEPPSRSTKESASPIAGNSSNQDSSVGARMRELERRQEQLKLVTLAMWTLLKEHSGLTEGDLKKYIEKVDLMDGKLDGKAQTKEKVHCGGCDRYILATALACPYCGQALKIKSPFSRA